MKEFTYMDDVICRWSCCFCTGKLCWVVYHCSWYCWPSHHSQDLDMSVYFSCHCLLPYSSYISVSGISAKAEITQQRCAGNALASIEQISELECCLKSLPHAGEPEGGGSCCQKHSRAVEQGWNPGTPGSAVSSTVSCDETLYFCAWFSLPLKFSCAF